MQKLPILTFEPLFKKVLWGGSRIAQFKGLPSQGDNIGESWELSCVPGFESVVADGPLKGKTLRELMADYSVQILGEKLAERFGSEFPLLVKLIDSADNLSVQVHPDDELAQMRHNCPGKTELWVSIAPLDGSFLYDGFARKISRGELRNRIADNTLVDVLGRRNTNPGDVFFLPAGRVHSIGKGNFLLEIQQSSDITYRIYDYARRDAQGNLRQLHIEEAFEAIDFATAVGSARSTIDWQPNREELIANCNHFTATAQNLQGCTTIDIAELRSFVILVALEGEAVLIDPDGQQTSLKQGHTILIPASMPLVAIHGNCKIITTYIAR